MTRDHIESLIRYRRRVTILTWLTVITGIIACLIVCGARI